MPKDAPILCPSGTCKPGSSLIGIVGSDGRVSLLEEPIPVDDNFVSMARLGRTPEKRFRFSTPCIEKGCQQWKNVRCGISDKAISVIGTRLSAQDDLPKCGIRASCRWFRQSGASACAVCPEVRTDAPI